MSSTQTNATHTIEALADLDLPDPDNTDIQAGTNNNNDIEFGNETNVNTNKPMSATGFMKKLVELYNRQSNTQVESTLNSVFAYFTMDDLIADEYNRKSVIVRVVAIMLRNNENKTISAKLHPKVMELFTNQPFIRVKLAEIERIDGDVLALRIDAKLTELSKLGPMIRNGNSFKRGPSEIIKFNQAKVIRANSTIADKIIAAIIPVESEIEIDDADVEFET